MRRTRKPPEDNLSSLVDTLTNVVGFLIMAVVITWISVTSVSSLSKGPEGESGPDSKITIEKNRLAEIKNLLKQAEQRWGPLQGQVPTARKELTDLNMVIEDLQKQLKKTLSTDKKTLETELQKQAEEIKRKESEVATAQEKLQGVKGRLNPAAHLPPAPKMVSLPDPHEPPAGCKPERFICRYGRVFPLNFEALDKKIEAAIRKAVNQPSGRINLDRSGINALINYFDRNDIGDEFLRVKVVDLGFVIFLPCEPRRKDQGETLEQIQDPNSEYQRHLKNLNKRQKFTHFLVWGDSFDVFLQARQFSDQADLLSGWVAFNESEEFKIIIGGGGGGGGRGPMVGE